MRPVGQKRQAVFQVGDLLRLMTDYVGKLSGFYGFTLQFQTRSDFAYLQRRPVID